MPLFRLALLLLVLLLSHRALAQDNFDKVVNFRNGIQIGGVPVDAVNLSGVTADAEELNVLDGIEATTEELNILSGVTATAEDLNQVDTTEVVGAVVTPVAGDTEVSESRVGSLVTTTFTFAATQLAVTSDTGGSWAATEIYEFPEGVVKVLGCRLEITEYAEGENLTSGNGDAVHEIGIGTTAMTAVRDGVLDAAEDDVCGDINGTDSDGAQTLAGVTGDGDPLDGTAAAKSLYLNWSGTDATVDASDTLDVTGTATITWLYLGDH